MLQYVLFFVIIYHDVLCCVGTRAASTNSRYERQELSLYGRVLGGQRSDSSNADVKECRASASSTATASARHLEEWCADPSSVFFNMLAISFIRRFGRRRPRGFTDDFRCIQPNRGEVNLPSPTVRIVARNTLAASHHCSPNSEQLRHLPKQKTCTSDDNFNYSRPCSSTGMLLKCASLRPRYSCALRNMHSSVTW